MRRMNKQDCLVLVLLLSGLVFSFWRAPFGNPSWDETSYLAMMHRFWLGDIPIIHEWHPTQFSALLTLPIYFAYLAIHGSTDGVVLFMRYLFLIVQALTAIFLYTRIRKYGWISLFCALLFFLTAKNEMYSLNYNGLGLILAMFAAVQLFLKGKHPKLDTYLAGIAFAGLTLCTPHMVFVYLVYSIVLLFRRVCHSETEGGWGTFTLGILTIAGIFLAVLLSEGSVSEYVSSIPELLSGADHSSSLKTGIIQYLALAKMIITNSVFTMIGVPAYVVLLILAWKNRGKKKIGNRYLMIGLLLTIVLLIGYQFGNNYSMVAFVPLGILVFILDQRAEEELKKFFLSGIGYMLMMNLSSNTILNGVQLASTVCMVPALLATSDLISPKKKKALFMLGCCGILMIGMDVVHKLTYCYVDDAPLNLHAVSEEEGPMRGICSTEENVQSYEDLQSIWDQSIEGHQNVLIYSLNRWLYLELQPGQHVASHTIWLKSTGESDLQQLSRYYEKNPDRIPDYVLVPYQSEADLEGFSEFLSAYGLNPEQTSAGTIYEKGE